MVWGVWLGGVVEWGCGLLEAVDDVLAANPLNSSAEESMIETTPPSREALIDASWSMASRATLCADTAVLLTRPVSRGIPELPRAVRVSLA